jgi:uncharacterized protein YjbI with pentapeptide repeats
LRDATLTGASLEHVGLVRTNLEGATISNSLTAESMGSPLGMSS